MVSLTMEIPHLLPDMVVDVLLGRLCEFHRCRRGEDRCAPTVHLLRNSLRAAHELRCFFLGPCTQVQGWGSCPQGHGPHYLVQDCCGISSETRHTHRVWTTTTTTTTTTRCFKFKR